MYGKNQHVIGNHIIEVNFRGWISDGVGEQKSGSGRVRGRHFGVGFEVGFLTSGFFGFGYFPLGESGFGVFKFL